MTTVKTLDSDALDYRRSVLINSDPKSAFIALTEQIDQWWGTTESSADQEGDVFKIYFGPESYWTFRVVSLKRPEGIVWQCIASHQDHHLPGIDAEWLNTKLHWHIQSKEEGVEVEFWHEGLVTTGVCYEVCSTAWDFYIMDSLKSFLETGLGKPGQN